MFVILIGGFIVVFAALMVEFAYQPPYWVHAALWLPLILLVTLGPLRPIKGVLIALQYHHKAAEGRLEQRGCELTAARRGPGVVVTTLVVLICVRHSVRPRCLAARIAKSGKRI